MMSLLNKNQKLLALIGLVFAILLFLDLTGISGPIINQTGRLLRPLQLGLHKTNQDFKNFLATIVEIRSLKETSARLEKENAVLAAENANLKRLSKENEALRVQLGAPKIATKNVLASVIGTDPRFGSARLILDKGTRAGIKKNNLVIFKDILIGKITEATLGVSTLTLLADPEMKVPALTNGGARGIVEGSFGSKPLLKRVSNADQLKEDEIVFTSGEAGFPKGLVLGKLQKIEKNPAQIFQEAELELLVQAENLGLVFVVLEEEKKGD